MKTSSVYQLQVETQKGQVCLGFTNLDQFVRIVGFQLGILFGHMESADDFLTLISKDLSKRWKEKESLGAFDLPEKANVLDIGSGVGLLDLVLAHTHSNCRIFLVDRGKETDSKKIIQWGSDHGFYNDWDVFEDLVAHSDLDRARFQILSPESDWPAELDLIMSSKSYLWHYPLETYWDRIAPHAQRGSRMCFDILNRPENSAEDYISQFVQSGPKSTPRPMPVFHWHPDELHNISDTYGKVCFWDVLK